MDIQPLHDRVVVARAEQQTTTPGGIVIPDSAAEKPGQGEVVAVGKGKTLPDGRVRDASVQVGDTVMFPRFAGTEVELDGSEYLIMREDDIMAVVED